VLGISPDTQAKMAKFQVAHKLKFALLADEDLAVHKKYGAYGTKSMYGRTYEGVLRSTFVVDEKGKLELALYNVKATGHVDSLRKQLGI
jgi:peroxiredoxin Q/BCP